MGVPSRSGDPREHNWDRTPAPGALPARFQPQWPPPRAQLGSPPLPPPGSDPCLAPPGFARPCRAPGAFPAAVGTPENTTGTAPPPRHDPNPTRADRFRPAPGVLQGCCPPSPVAPGEPRPHARCQERHSDLTTAARSNMRTIHTPHRDNPSCL